MASIHSISLTVAILFAPFITQKITKELYSQKRHTEEILQHTGYRKMGRGDISCLTPHPPLSQVVPVNPGSRY